MTTKNPSAKVGRPSVITDAISAFVETLRLDSEDYDELWYKEWETTLAGKSPATRASYTSQYRKAVREALGEHPALAFIKVLDRRDDPLRTASRSTSGGRPNSRRELIERFATDVAALNVGRSSAVDHGSSQGLADANYKRALAKRWSEEIEEMRAALAASTVLNTTSLYRNELRNRGLDDEVTLSMVTAPEDIMKTRSVAYRESIIKQHHDLVPVYNWRELLDAAKAALPDTQSAWQSLNEEAEAAAEDISRAAAVKIGVALCFVTGRRPYEVFCQGEFRPAPIDFNGETVAVSHTKVRGYESWRILFNGQAKTRGMDGTQFDQTFVIPTLAPAKSVLFAWHVLRASEHGRIWKDMTSEEFKNDLLRVPSLHCILPVIRDEMFEELWPVAEVGDSRYVADAKKLKANNFRALYAEIADQFFRPNSKSKAAYFAEVLGHTEKDIETASAYMKYWLPDQKDAGATRRVKKRLSKKIEDQADKKGLIPFAGAVLRPRAQKA